MFNIVKFITKFKIRKNNIIKMVISKKNYNNFVYFFLFYKKMRLYRK